MKEQYSKFIVEREKKEIFAVPFNLVIEQEPLFKENENQIYFNEDLKLIAKDKDYIFSFYGENGAGKTSICERICFKRVISIKKELLNELKSECLFAKNNKRMSLKLSPFFLKSYKTEELLEWTNEDRKKLNNVLEKYKNGGQNKEYHELLSSLKKIKIEEFNIEREKINLNIFNWQAEQKSKKNFVFYVAFLQYGLDKNDLHHIVRVLEDFSIQNKISFELLLNKYESFREKLILFDIEKLTNILNDENYGSEILNYIKKIYSRAKKVDQEYKEDIKRSTKILSFIDIHLKKDFLEISKNFIRDIQITNEYSSFLDLEYKKILIVESEDMPSIDKNIYKIEDFFKILSEAQIKLLKFLFILAKVGAYADNKTVIVADDILESIDNKNLINIINLIKIVLERKKPSFLFFTHDFEIFGMVNKILKVNKESSYIISRQEREIYFKNINTKDMTLEEYVRNKKHINHPIQIKILYFLVLCVYGRNLVERTLGDKSDAYIMITSILHLKTNSEEVISNINLIRNLKFLDFFSNDDIREIEEFSKEFSSYFGMVKNVFEYCKKTNIDKIELNIFLSLYGRLYIEEVILKKLTTNITERNTLLSSIKTYQTGALIKKYGNDININALNDYITKFIHINQGLSYLINIDSHILLKLINNIK